MMHERTPQAVPKTASNFLEAAARTLGERGKQYDPNGKQERSMTAIVAAFNAIYPIQLTVHMGWQFMALVKMVRGATKPHIDSALDQVAYAALAAEEVASGLQATQSSKLGSTLQEALCKDEGCPHHCMPHICITSVETAEQYKARCAEQHEAEVARLKAIIATQDARLHNLQLTHKGQVTELVAELDSTHASLSDFVCRFDLTKEYMTKEQVLAGQAKHEEQVAKLQARELMAIDSLNNLRIELQQLRAELADKNNLLKDAEARACNHSNLLERAEQQFADERAAHKTTDATVSRLLAKNNALCNEVRNLEVAVASVRNSLKVSEDAASKLQAKVLYHQEQHNATSLELRKEMEAHQQTKNTSSVRYI